MIFRNKEYIKNIFNSIANKYDLMNSLMSLGLDQHWKKSLINSLKTRKFSKSIDLAGGTGSIAKSLKDNEVVEEVYLVDLSSEMISVAKKNECADFYHEASAEQLPFENEEFDLITCAYGLRNFSNPLKAIKEAHRVLKKGGILSFLELTKPENLASSTLHALHCQAIPFLGKIVTKDYDSYNYLKKSIANFPSVEVISKILEKEGFEIIKNKKHKFGCMEIIAQKV